MKRASAKRLFARGVWLAAALMGLGGLQHDGYAQGWGTLQGQKAPEFHIAGICGEPYSLDTFKGHVLVMQFGSSW